jgi:hypothetical protein
MASGCTAEASELTLTIVASAKISLARVPAIAHYVAFVASQNITFILYPSIILLASGKVVFCKAVTKLHTVV